MLNRYTLQVAFISLLSSSAIVLILLKDQLVKTWAKSDSDFYQSPTFFPSIALGLVAISGIGLILSRLKEKGLTLDTEIQSIKPQPIVVTQLLSLFIGYILIIPWLGYFLSTLTFLTLALRITGARGKTLLFQPLAISSISYGLFVCFLEVWFPTSWLMEQFIRTSL